MGIKQCNCHRTAIINVEGLIGFRLKRFVGDETVTHSEPAHSLEDTGVVLVCEARLPFQPPIGNASGIDPLA